jgi:hypothetical protein
MLGTVFPDWGVESASRTRLGFGALVDVRRLVGTFGVVLPSRDHLSTRPTTLATLEHQIRRTGARLVLVDELETTVTAFRKWKP